MPGWGAPMRTLILAAVLSLPSIGQAEPLPDADYAALSRAVIDQVVVPAYAEHARATKALGPAIERHCMGSSAADAAAIHAAFGEAMDGWQRAWPFSFGPVMHGAGRARIAFWPDRRGSAARQMRNVLRNRDEALLDAGKLAGKSVAIKDFQASNVSCSRRRAMRIRAGSPGPSHATSRRSRRRSSTPGPGRAASGRPRSPPVATTTGTRTMPRSPAT